MECIDKNVERFNRECPTWKCWKYTRYGWNHASYKCCQVKKKDDGKRIFKKFKTGIDFKLNENKKPLYLPSSMEKNVFRLTHDENMHAGIRRCFNRLTKIFYIPHFFLKNPALYWALSQLSIHSNEKTPILWRINVYHFPPQYFHTITIDFVLILFGKLNALFNVIYKFTRKFALILKKFIYNTNQWVNALLDRSFIIDWSISAVIIPDRDPEFFSGYMANVFQSHED